MPDGGSKEFSSRPSALELAGSVNPRLAKKAVGALINKESQVQDIRSLLKDGDQVEIVAIPSKKALEVIRHSSAHVLAQAVQNLWPEVKVTIGPVIENGFYYDFDADRTFTDKDLERIEQEMKSLLKKNYELTKEIWTKEKACAYFEQKGELLKKEIIEGLGEKEVSVYKQGPWLDLCRGPHVQRLGQIGAVKILSQSGAYWRGDSSNKQLLRIYGTAFHTEKELKAFLQKQEEAKRYDHRQMGKKLSLFWFSDLSPGNPFFTPSGAEVYRRMQGFLREKYREYGYEEVITPQIYHSDLFRRSGHLQHFADNMYPILEAGKNKENISAPSARAILGAGKDEQSSEMSAGNSGPTEPDTKQRMEEKQLEREYFLKPMNCPGHCLLYKKERRSYRDLPWRVADFGRLHRREPPGSLHGLTRVKSFCQDDAHIFCRLSQLSQEIQNGIQMLQDIYKTFGLKNYQVELSTRPKDRMGADRLWDQAEEALSSALKKLNIPAGIQPGEGAFYGPKLDISVRDAFDRSWQLGTFQCDFNLPEAFGLSYTSEKDREERPVLLHRAILGSLERFMGIYLEHCKGRLPAWLSPVQAIILPLTDKEHDFSLQIQKELELKGIVCKIDKRNEKLSYKIRESQNQQIPYMLVIGKKEAQSRLLSVRLRTGELFSDLNAGAFARQLAEDIHSRQAESFLLKNSFKGN